MTPDLSHLSNSEFVAYLDKHSSDPCVNRLVRIMQSMTDIKFDLESVGMNPDSNMFAEDGEYLAPSNYILSLRDNINLLNELLSEANTEIDRLSKRTVLELIDSLRVDIQQLTIRAIDAETRARVAVDQKQIALDKLKMWSILATE
jgi:hypothetical protein